MGSRFGLLWLFTGGFLQGVTSQGVYGKDPHLCPNRTGCRVIVSTRQALTLCSLMRVEAQQVELNIRGPPGRDDGPVWV